MLDAVQTQLSAISADGANWSVAKVFAFLALAFGFLTLLATLYLMWKHKVFRTLESAPKEGVIRTGTSFITTGAFNFFIAVMFLPLVIAYIFLFNTYMLSPYASLPALFGFINIYAGINDRLTYDESGIRQYMAFRKVRAIQWDGLENMVYRRFAQRLMLSGGGTTVTIALDNPDAQRFLEFMAERVTGEMRNTVEQIQLAKTDGKQV